MTTYINEVDVMQVANDLEQVVTSEIVDKVLMYFDDEMSMDNRSWEIVVQDLINEFKTELSLVQLN